MIYWINFEDEQPKHGQRILLAPLYPNASGEFKISDIQTELVYIEQPSNKYPEVYKQEYYEYMAKSSKKSILKSEFTNFKWTYLIEPTKEKQT